LKNRRKFYSRERESENGWKKLEEEDGNDLPRRIKME